MNNDGPALYINENGEAEAVNIVNGEIEKEDAPATLTTSTPISSKQDKP